MRTRIHTAVALAVTAVALTLAPAASAAPPAVTDTWASGVTATAVDLHALVNPEGLLTTARIEYLTLAAYEANINAALDPFTGAVKSPLGSGFPLGSGAIDAEIARHITGLAPNAAYRYRASASNAEGTAIGPTRPFATQENAPAFSLPDGRGWELVSPVDKNGGEIQAAGGNFDGGVLQASADGSSVTYTSAFSFAGGAGAPGASQYLSTRNPGDWSTQNITAPTLSGAYGAHPDGVPYQLFSGDLARGLLVIPQRCETAPCPRGYSLRQSANGALASSPEATDLAFAGSNPDLTQIVLSTQGNLYRFSGGALSAINLKPGDGTPTPGATLAAQSGAISSDGSRAYFNLEGNLYLRQGAQTMQVDGTQGGGGTFQTASSDGGTAFFTKAGHLYRYLTSTNTATDLTPGGEVQGVLGASPDGSYLYYLTSTGLFLSHSGVITKVAAAADASNYPPATGTARIAANGTLAFLSQAPLSEYDNEGLSEVYLYAPASDTLTCASCNPTGARPLGPARIPGAIANGKPPGATQAYKPRVLTASAGRLFFDSEDALVTTDSNNDWDVYEWEADGVGSCQRPTGCIALISSGRATEGASFLDASADGNDAFFLTDGSLVPTDPGVVDVYDAKVGGGFPAPQVPIACVGDACQVVPGEPEDPSPGTAFYKPEGNPAPSYPKVKKPKKHQAKKHHHKKKGRGKKANAKKGSRK